MQAAAGTITGRRGADIQLGSPITVRYVPLPVSRTSAEHPSFEVIVPNTAIPPRRSWTP